MSDIIESQKRCCFCNKLKNEVEHLIGTEEVKICDSCLKDGNRALARRIQAAEGNPDEKPLPKPREILSDLNLHVVGQLKAKTDVAIAVYNHYKRRKFQQEALETDEVKIMKSNILMAGPSGVGKTEIIRSIAKLLNVPLFVGDATKLTQTGYVGDDVETLLQGLVQAADNDIEKAEWGIVVIDEMDKLARKSGRSATGYRDVSGESVQQSLLKMLEGHQVVIPKGLNRNMTGGAVSTINTENILFIGMGSFQGIEEIIQDRLASSPGVGFGKEGKKKALTISEAFSQITEDDILAFGFIPELVGRMPVLTSTIELTEEEIVRILTEPKNSILKQFQALLAMDDITLTFDEEALRAIGKEAKKRPTGARALRSIVELVLRRHQLELPSKPGPHVLNITKEEVLNPGDVMRVMMA